jgi:predicted homoserine dehydrogenase-like protein
MLERLRSHPAGIDVAIIGMGAMGKGLHYQCGVTPGLRCVAVVDVLVERAIASAERLKLDYEVVTSAAAMNAAIERGKLAVCEDGDLAARCDAAHVVIESTSAILAGGRFAETALGHGKHVVMMNAEADLVFGPCLLQVARDHDVVYTSCDGDQHGVLKRLIDELVSWGLDLVMAGNIKGFLDRDSNPTKIVPEADKRRLDYRMATAYTDGTKLAIEMALLANGLGLRTLVPGMIGPRARHVQEVFDLFDFEAVWSDRRPCVDYILGAEPGGGVFAIGFCDDDYQREMLAYYKLGPGPFYLFYRPYHLCHVEAMRCVAEAALERRALLEPSFGFRTNVFTYAKRDLPSGECLDGVGGYGCYGLIENHVAGEPGGLPICLAEDVILKRDVTKGEKIHFEDVTYDPRRADFALYARALECGAEIAR